MPVTPEAVATLVAALRYAREVFQSINDDKDCPYRIGETVFKTIDAALSEVLNGTDAMTRADQMVPGFGAVAATLELPETPNDREALRLQMERATQMEALASWRERGVL